MMQFFSRKFYKPQPSIYFATQNKSGKIDEYIITATISEVFLFSILFRLNTGVHAQVSNR